MRGGRYRGEGWGFVIAMGKESGIGVGKGHIMYLEETTHNKHNSKPSSSTFLIV